MGPPTGAIHPDTTRHSAVVAYHVNASEGWKKSAVVYDLDEAALHERVLRPRARGEVMWVGGEGYDLGSLKVKIQIREGAQTD